MNLKQLDPKNKGVKDLKAKILRRKHELDEKEKRRLQRIADEEKEKQLLTQTIKVSNTYLIHK